MPKAITSIPSARQLMQSLRDIGYTFPTAVADLVDNSVAAGASEVSIDVAFAGVRSWVRITDNGTGMDAATLNEALRFGNTREYGDHDLGRFGLGLKTASLSQSRKLTVASRMPGKDIVVRCWDLDHINKVDKWQILVVDPGRCRKEIVGPLQKHAGTVVLWEQLDRVLDYKDPDGRRAQKGLASLCGDLYEHLAMVFHRFLSGTARRTIPLAIHLNKRQVVPWDPFVTSHPKTHRLEQRNFQFEYSERLWVVRVQPYILPTQAQFATSKEHELAGGPNKWNRQQGFYIYRNDRMIQSGGWNWLRAADEHTKLARVALDFSAGADPAFRINVAKMSVVLPSEIREDLKAVATEVAAQADKAYRQKPERHATIPHGTLTGSGSPGASVGASGSATWAAGGKTGASTSNSTSTSGTESASAYGANSGAYGGNSIASDVRSGAYAGSLATPESGSASHGDDEGSRAPTGAVLDSRSIQFVLDVIERELGADTLSLQRIRHALESKTQEHAG